MARGAGLPVDGQALRVAVEPQAAVRVAGARQDWAARRALSFRRLPGEGRPGEQGCRGPPGRQGA